MSRRLRLASDISKELPKPVTLGWGLEVNNWYWSGQDYKKNCFGWNFHLLREQKERGPHSVTLQWLRSMAVSWNLYSHQHSTWVRAILECYEYVPSFWVRNSRVLSASSFSISHPILLALANCKAPTACEMLTVGLLLPLRLLILKSREPPACTLPATPSPWMRGSVVCFTPHFRCLGLLCC